MAKPQFSKSSKNFQGNPVYLYFCQIKSYFHNLSPLKWFLFCLIILIITQILMHPGILHVTYFYSEDGTIFFNHAKDGFSAFITPYGGYLATLSRLIAGTAYVVMLITNSIIAAGETIEILSIVTVALICAYFASDSFCWIIASRAKRLSLMIALILLMGGFINMFYNTVDLHWWCGIFAFFISLNLMHGKHISWWIIPPTLLAILSSPSTFFIIFPCLYNLIEYGYKNQKFKNILIILALCVQAFFVFFVPSQIASQEGLDTALAISNHFFMPDDLIYWISHLTKAILSAPYFIFGSIIHLFVHANIFFLISSIIVLILFIYHNRKNHSTLKDIALTLTAISTIYGMIMLKNGLIDYSLSFYHSTIAGIILIFFGIQLYRSKLRSYLFHFVIPSLIFLYCIISIPLSPIDLKPNLHLTTVDAYVDHNSDTTTRITITPDSGFWGGKWYLDIPVKPEYYDKYTCLEFQDDHS